MRGRRRVVTTSILCAVALTGAVGVPAPAGAVSGVWVAAGRNITGHFATGQPVKRSLPTLITTPNAFDAVVAGETSLGIAPNGSLLCWGQCANGIPRSTPVTVANGPFKAVSSRLVLDTNGHVYTTLVGTITQVGTDTWNAIATGSASDQYNKNYLAIRSDGGLYGWGANGWGQLGIGTAGAPVSTPTRVGTATWKVVSTGIAHTLAIRSDGALFAWGDNRNGDLGLGDTTARYSPARVGSATWKAVWAAGHSSFAIRSDGALYAWGDNWSGQLGVGDTNERHSPTRVGGGSLWKTVASGFDHTLAIRSDGLLWSWGGNERGQLGIGNRTTHLTPVQVGTNIYTAVAADGFDSIASNVYGMAYAFGAGDLGELADHVLVSSAQFTGTLLNGDVTAGQLFTISLHSDGTLWCAGYCVDLLNNTALYAASTPIRLGGSTLFARVNARYGNVVAVARDGSLWGRVGAGQFAPVAGGTWISTSVGVWTAYAIRSDGALFSWGNNAYGELGLGTNAASVATPTRIGTSTWKSVSGGMNYAVALRSDGALFGWGANASNQLGLGADTGNHNAPVRIGTDVFKTALATANSTYAIRTDGALLSWGADWVGQLGDGTSGVSDVRQAPARVGTDTWKAVAGNGSSIAAIRSDGALFAWGSNDNGELGLGYYGTRAADAAPQRVGSLTTWTGVAASGYALFAAHT